MQCKVRTDSNETAQKIKKSSPMLHRVVIHTVIDIIMMSLAKEKKLNYSRYFLLKKGETYVIVLEIILSKMFKMSISELKQ